MSSAEPGPDLPPRALRVVPFQGDGSEWDALVAGFSGGTFCHLHAWGSILSDAMGHEAFHWVALDESDRPIGALPLVRVRSRIFGDYLLSMPFLNDGGPLGDIPARGALGVKAMEEAARMGVDLLELRNRDAMPGDLSVSQRKLTVLLDLPESSDALWNDGFKAKLRSQIRRPMKEGMIARFGLDQMEPFYEIFAATMRDLGTPVLPKRFFERVAERLGDQVVFVVIEHGGRVAAAACGFAWGREFEITWAGARGDLAPLSPNMLLYWSLMEESIRRGLTVFNFGRCTRDSGTHRFKRQWGGVDHPLPWAQWTPTGVASTPDPTSAKYRLATRAWARLPIGVANRLGPLLARSLP